MTLKEIKIMYNENLIGFKSVFDLKFEGVITKDNNIVEEYVLNYINDSIYQVYNNSSFCKNEYEHIIVVFIQLEDYILKDFNTIDKLTLFETGKSLKGEYINKNTELLDMKLAYYCDTCNLGKVKECMLVFSSKNIKSSNVKKEVNEILNRRQQECLIDKIGSRDLDFEVKAYISDIALYSSTIADALKSISENLKQVKQ